jgi:hypothetical protein
MVAGDLVVIAVLYRDTIRDLTIGNTGGQTWTAETQRNQNSVRFRVFHCVFNGTWSANPTVTISVTAFGTMLSSMVVYRPAAGMEFVFDTSAGGTAAAPSAPGDLSRSLPATTDAGVTLVLHGSQISNTWANQTSGYTGIDGGTGVTAEYRRNSFVSTASLAFTERLRSAGDDATSITIRQTSGTLSTSGWQMVSYREQAAPVSASAVRAVSIADARAGSIAFGPQDAMAVAIVATALGRAAEAGELVPVIVSATRTVATARPRVFVRWDWAAIENGVVTDLQLGALPASTDTVLYWPLARSAVIPLVGWYFNEPCNVFTATRPQREAGSTAPPFPPGGPPPDPDDYAPDPEIDGPSPDDDQDTRNPVLPTIVAFHANEGALITIAAAPAALTELSPRLRTRVDLSACCSLALQAHIVAPVSAARLVLLYTLNQGATWQPVWTHEDDATRYGPWLRLSTAGTRAGRFVPPDVAAPVIVSPFIEGGDNASGVEIGNLNMLMYNRVFPGRPCPDGDDEPACAVEELPELEDYGTPFWREEWAYASSAALRAQYNGFSSMFQYGCNGINRGAYCVLTAAGATIPLPDNTLTYSQRTVVLRTRPITRNSFASQPTNTLAQIPGYWWTLEANDRIGFQLFTTFVDANDWDVVASPLFDLVELFAPRTIEFVEQRTLIPFTTETRRLYVNGALVLTSTRAAPFLDKYTGAGVHPLTTNYFWNSFNDCVTLLSELYLGSIL